MALLDELAKEVPGATPEGLRRLFVNSSFTNEVAEIDAKIASVNAERTKANQAFEAQLTELNQLRDEAQKRADEALGKG